MYTYAEQTRLRDDRVTGRIDLSQFSAENRERVKLASAKRCHTGYSITVRESPTALPVFSFILKTE